MKSYFGIYGFEISQHTEFANFIIEPVVKNHVEANKLAVDRKIFNLTAIGKFTEKPDRQALFDLSGIMTFCQQQWVVVTNIHEFSNNFDFQDVIPKFPPTYETTNHRPTSGALILSDRLVQSGRVDFFKLCLEKLSDETFENATNFRKSFFRNVESWRMPHQMIDLTYYLNFSALEILSRTIANDFQSSVAAVSCRLLQQHGFPVSQDNIQERHLGMQTYARLRNSLFHNGEFEVTFQENQQTVTLRLSDYYRFLSSLVPDILLKVIGYNNNKINWNRWIDRMPFQ